MKRHYIFSLILIQIVKYTYAANSKTFRAAVVEYEPTTDGGQVTLESMLENAYSLAEYAMKARWADADVLVFPEYGLTGLVNPDRDSGSIAFAQEIPDPKSHNWNPCDEPDRFENTKVIHVLSCAAKFNALVLAVNLISREECDAITNGCPSDGYFYYNTNVIFHKNGTLAARYYKNNLFKEPNLNTPNEPELTIVDIGFTKISCIICFDIVHKHPTIYLIKEKGLKTIAFSTAWLNILPFFTAPQIYTSFARGLGVNLIAANLFAPQRSCMGSGIATSNAGILNQTFDLSSPGKMIIADIPIRPVEVTAGPLLCDEDEHEDHSEEIGEIISFKFPLNPFTETKRPASEETENVHNFINLPLTSFNFLFFDPNKKENHVDMCKNAFCCHFDYGFSNKDDTIYAFAINNGAIDDSADLLGSEFHVQACAILRCESEDPQSCGRVPQIETNSSFERLSIQAGFDTDVVLPQIFGTNLQIVNDNEWSFHATKCHGDVTVAKMALTNAVLQPIMSASLIGHLYDRNENK